LGCSVRATRRKSIKSAEDFKINSHELRDGQGGFKNPQICSRRRQSAHFSSITEISADSRRRPRFLESALPPPSPPSVSVFPTPLSLFPPVGSWVWD